MGHSAVVDFYFCFELALATRGVREDIGHNDII